MQSESEKQKTKWYFVSLAVLALVINWRVYGMVTGEDRLWSGSSSAPITTVPLPATQQQEEPSQSSVVISAGEVTITPNGITDFPMSPGEGLIVAAIEDVAYDEYVNDQYHGTVYPKNSNMPRLQPYVDADLRKLGYRLTPGQSKDAVQLAYMKYHGSEPPSDWYNRALANANIPNVPTATIPQSTPMTAPRSALGPSGVLFSDDFKGYTIDTAKWAVSGQEVYQQSGTMYIETTAADDGGNLRSVPIGINPSGLITITRLVSLHPGNEFFDGEFGLKIGSMPPCSIRYADMGQPADPKYRPCHGFFITKRDSKPDIVNDTVNVSGPVSPIWDKYFNEKIIYNPITGYMEYFINDTRQQSFFVGVPAYSDALTMQLHFTAWGWYTGHEQQMQSITVTQEPSGS